jgi:hypothetical protein
MWPGSGIRHLRLHGELVGVAIILLCAAVMA